METSPTRPKQDCCGRDGFEFSARDANAAGEPAAVLITVECVNDAPVANGDTASTEEDIAVLIDVADNDIDVDLGDVVADLVITVESGPTEQSPSLPTAHLCSKHQPQGS